jgi:hypothetical protein
MTGKKKAPRTQKKRPYRTPKLLVHGDLRTMTKAKGGCMADNAKPATRSNAVLG